MKPHVCFGICTDGQSVREFTCPLRDDCQYYPRDIRWLANNYDLTETFGDGRVGEIHPPKAPLQDFRCPYFLPRPQSLKRKTISTPFD